MGQISLIIITAFVICGISLWYMCETLQQKASYFFFFFNALCLTTFHTCARYTQSPPRLPPPSIPPTPPTPIDDLRKSRGLHSVSAYRSRPAGVAQSRHAFVGGTVSTWARWRIPVNKGRKGIRNADQVLTVRGEHADRIVGSPRW